MTEYEVVWRIDIDATSAREAARKAREIMLDPTSTATVFEVTGPATEQVDLFDEVAAQYPLIDLPGSDEWRSSYEMGEVLDKAFPGQDASDLMVGCSYNDWGPLKDGDRRIVSLECIQHGENDGQNWIWHVGLDNGTQWVVEGGCDYTGWDCQSGLTWEAR